MLDTRRVNIKWRGRFCAPGEFVVLFALAGAFLFGVGLQSLLATPLTANRPAVDGFFPFSGAPGTSVTITGSNLTGVREVHFNTGLAIFTSVSASQLIATVPLDATTGPISIATPFGTVATFGWFTVAPRITDFSPTNAAPGTLVLIAGANFAGTLAVQFNNKNAASFFVAAETQIHALVPAGASSGPIRVITPAGAASSANSFVVTGTEPIISDFSPTNGAPGTVVVLEGRNFLGATAVRFGTNQAASFSVTAPTQIHATVPPGAATGPIRVTTPSGTGDSAQLFVVTTRPIISEFSPTNGPPGTIVVLDGFNFTGATSVQFNGANAVRFSVTSPTQITAAVPTNAVTGPLSVTTPSGTGSSLRSFVVATSPIITEFSPIHGPPGTIVVIDGINFTGASAVRFHSTAALQFSVTSPTQISATVPRGATTGPITVTTSKGAGGSTNLFTVTAGVPIITGFSPGTGRPGTSVIVEGLDFTGATAVAFNGANAAFAVTAPTQITCLVPDGATTGPITVTTPVGTGLSGARFIVVPAITGFTPTNGVAGTRVVIRGANFTDVIAVRFNGEPAGFTNTSPREIATFVPVKGLSGPISVTTAAGIVASTNTFLILPNILGFSPAAGPVGTRVTIVGTHLADAVSVQFNGAAGTLTPVSSTEVQAVVPLGASTGLIGITTLSGNAQSATPFIVGAILPEPFALDIGPASENRVAVSWPAAATNYALQSVELLTAAAAWITVTNPPTVIGGTRTVILPVSSQHRFYRLRQP